jgi:hypothetical protein
MFVRDTKNDKLIKASKQFGLELQGIPKTLYEIILHQLNGLSEFQDATVDSLRNTVLAHIFQHLNSYANPKMDARWLDHPTVVAASRAFQITIVIIEESDSEKPIIIKQPNSLKNIYLAYSGDQQYDVCQSSGTFSRSNINEMILTTPEDKHELQSANVRDALFETANQAINTTVTDPNYMGWFQILVGPKACLPNKQYHRDLIIIKNEIYCALTALNTVIRFSLPLIEKDFLEQFLADVYKDKKESNEDIQNRLRIAREDLKKAQLRLIQYTMKIAGATDPVIQKAKENFNYAFKAEKFQFTQPEMATSAQISYLNQFSKLEEQQLNTIHLILKEEDDLVANVALEVNELIKNAKAFFQERLVSINSAVDNINWREPQISEFLSYVKTRAREYIQQIYQQPLPVECIPKQKVRNPVLSISNKPEAHLVEPSANSIRVLYNLDRVSAKMYRGDITYFQFLQNKLNKFEFVIKEDYEVSRETLVDRFKSAHARQKPILDKINDDYLDEITLNKISGSVKQNFIAECKAEIASAHLKQVDVIDNLIPKDNTTKLNTLFEILQKHLLGLKSKLDLLENSVTSEQKEKDKYISHASTWLTTNSTKVSTFIRLFTPDEFSSRILESGVHENTLEKFCETNSGDTLLHKANGYSNPNYYLNNVVLVIKYLIMHGANIFAKNKKGDYACDIRDNSFTYRLPWTIARTQLELLSIYSSNLAELVTKTLLSYVVRNESSWLFIFHNQAVKKTRLELVYGLFISLNESRMETNDDKLMEQLRQMSIEVLDQNRSHLKTTLIGLFKEIKSNDAVVSSKTSQIAADGLVENYDQAADLEDMAKECKENESDTDSHDQHEPDQRITSANALSFMQRN